MVDGVGKGPTGHSTLKLKGKDGKSINLENLKGLQKTAKNEALFKMYDKDGNGVIDEKEATVMRNNLQSLAGNGKISKQELSQLFGKNSKAAMEALSTLADQQAAFADGVEYTETSKNNTTHIYQSNVGSEYSYRFEESTFPDGTVEMTMDDGSTEIRFSDGEKITTDANGVKILYDAKGKKLALQNPDKTQVRFSEDGNASFTYNTDGKKVSSHTLEGDNEVITTYDPETGNRTRKVSTDSSGKTERMDFEYDGGKTITRFFNGAQDDAKLTGINVSENVDGHSIQTLYNSEDDMKNGRPSVEVRDGQNPTLKTTLNYEYDSKGNRKITTTNSAGEKTVSFLDKDGKEIPSNQFDAPEAYTVQKGESITKIVTRALEQQGFTAEDLKNNPQILKNARAEFLEANKDSVKTYNGPKTELKGNQFFYPNDQVIIPNFTINARTLEEVVITPEKTKSQQVDANLGDEVRLEEDPNGRYSA